MKDEVSFREYLSVDLFEPSVPLLYIIMHISYFLLYISKVGAGSKSPSTFKGHVGSTFPVYYYYHYISNEQTATISNSFLITSAPHTEPKYLSTLLRFEIANKLT